MRFLGRLALLAVIAVGAAVAVDITDKYDDLMRGQADGIRKTFHDFPRPMMFTNNMVFELGNASFCGGEEPYVTDLAECNWDRYTEQMFFMGAPGYVLGLALFPFTFIIFWLSRCCCCGRNFPTVGFCAGEERTEGYHRGCCSCLTVFIGLFFIVMACATVIGLWSNAEFDESFRESIETINTTLLDFHDSLLAKFNTLRGDMELATSGDLLEVQRLTENLASLRVTMNNTLNIGDVFGYYGPLVRYIHYALVVIGTVVPTFFALLAFIGGASRCHCLAWTFAILGFILSGISFLVGGFDMTLLSFASDFCDYVSNSANYEDPSTSPAGIALFAAGANNTADVLRKDIETIQSFYGAQFCTAYNNLLDRSDADFPCDDPLAANGKCKPIPNNEGQYCDVDSNFKEYMYHTVNNFLVACTNSEGKVLGNCPTSNPFHYKMCPEEAFDADGNYHYVLCNAASVSAISFEQCATYCNYEVLRTSSRDIWSKQKKFMEYQDLQEDYVAAAADGTLVVELEKKISDHFCVGTVSSVTTVLMAVAVCGFFGFLTTILSVLGIKRFDRRYIALKGDRRDKTSMYNIDTSKDKDTW